jgi:hypothetical protein
MVATTHAGSADDSHDEAVLLDRARALRAELSDTFDRVLASQGLGAADLARLVRRLEHDPVSRRELEAARREACGAAAPPTAPGGTSQSLPRHPRALRV